MNVSGGLQRSPSVTVEIAGAGGEKQHAQEGGGRRFSKRSPRFVDRGNVWRKGDWKGGIGTCQGGRGTGLGRVGVAPPPETEFAPGPGTAEVQDEVCGLHPAQLPGVRPLGCGTSYTKCH